MAYRSPRRRTLIEAVIDLTPMIDCVFLLIIFLLITTTFKKKQLALELNLPKAGATEFRVQSREHQLRVAQDGGMYLCPNEVSEKDTDALKCTNPTDKQKLVAEFKKLAESFPGVRVGIYADAEVPYQWIVQVVAAATEAGLDLSLPYETEKD